MEHIVVKFSAEQRGGGRVARGPGVHAHFEIYLSSHTNGDRKRLWMATFHEVALVGVQRFSIH